MTLYVQSMLDKYLLWCFLILVLLFTLLINDWHCNGCISSRFGVNEHVYEWFHSYLSGRTQIVSTPAVTSNATAHIWSVTQGSVVWPLLFIAYTEDVEDLIETVSINNHMYAEDTKLFAHMRLTEVLRCRRNVERCVGHIQDWCTSKRLKHNS